MIRCEDFPCCGHEAGECPRYNAAGQRLCIECDRIAVKNGLCRTCMISQHRRYREYAFDGTGQDCE